MSVRIKFTGYLPIDEFEPGEVDLDHPSGLSEEAYGDYLGPEGELKLSDLEDVTSEVVID